MKSWKKTLSKSLCVVMILSLTITNFKLTYAEDLIEGMLSKENSEDTIDLELPIDKNKNISSSSNLDEDNIIFDDIDEDYEEIINEDYEEEPEEDEEEDASDIDDVNDEATSDIDDVEDILEEEGNIIDENATDIIEEDIDEINEEEKEATISEVDELENNIDEDNILNEVKEENDEVATSSEMVDEINGDVITSETERSIDDVATLSEIDGLVHDVIGKITPSDALNMNAVFGSINKASDSEMSKEQLYAGGYVRSNFIPSISKNKKKNNVPLFGADSLPSSYDARTITNPANPSMSIVPPIRNQNPYGVCWAFATIGLMETSIRKQGLVTSEEESDLSEAALSYFHYNLDKIYNNATNIDIPGLEGKDYLKVVGSNWSQAGGNQQLAALMMSAFMGVVAEDENTKFEKMSNIVSSGLDGYYAYHNNKFAIKNVKYINKSDTTAIKKAIMQNGSVGMGYWSGSIFGEAFMNKEGNERYFLSNKTPGKADHAVMIVGWDDTIPHTKFGHDNVSTTTDGAWLIRNSWGDDIDLLNDGYFWLSYAEPSIDFDMYTIEAMKKDDYKYNYHYDTTGYPGDRLINKAGNIFKVAGEQGENQVLDAVSVVINKADQEFDIKVYTKDIAMSNPEDGTLCLTQSVTTNEGGIYTIPLTTSVPINYDTYFSVVIEGTNGAISLGTDVNQILNMSGNIDFYNMVNEGQSYVYQYGNWEDCNKGLHNSYSDNWGVHNYRIKALTNPGSGIGFNANGGTGSMARVGGVEGDTVSLPANTFTRDGYTFTGWNTKADGTGTSYSDEQSGITIGSSAVTLYAQWNPITYKVEFNPNGQTGSIATISYAYDAEINLANPGFTSSEYTFGGWQTLPGNKAKVYNEEQTGVKGLATHEGDIVVLYAHWLPGSYKVKFNAHGGEGTMDIQNITRDTNTPLTNNSFTKTGYVFKEWSTEESGGGTTYANKQSVSNLASKDQTIDLYAQWTPITYTIKYNANGGSITPTSVSKTYDTNISLGIPTKTGYTFNGWFSDSLLNTSFDGSTDICTTNNGNVNIYAKWTANTYIIQFDVDGHATAPSPVTKTYGQNLSLPQPTSPESGYLFVGWCKDSPTGVSYTGNTDLSETQGDSITVYAKWKLQIIFDANGHGTNPASKDVVATAISLPNISCPGYVFGGWYQESGCTTFIGNAGASYTPTGAITFYAKWTPITYVIKYNKIEGATIATSSALKTYGTNIILENPSKEGYEFVDWYSNTGLTTLYDGTTDLTTVAGQTVNIYAKWAPITYTIVYETSGHGTPPANKTKTYNTNYSLPKPTNIVLGYTFVGWYSDNTLTTPYNGTSDLATTQNTTITLYSKWKAKVTFAPNGQGNAPPAVDVVLGETTTLPSINAVTGYDFGGWFADASCSSSIGNTGDTYTVNEVKTLYAKWTLAAGYIEAKFETNGGSSVKSQAVLPGSKFSKPSSPTKSGFKFANWYKENELLNIYDFSQVATESIILYAKWNQGSSGGGGSSSGSSSSSGGGGGSDGGGGKGPTSPNSKSGGLSPNANNVIKNNPNNAITVKARTKEDVVVASNQVSWRYDVANGTWSLSIDVLAGAPAQDGFFVIVSFDNNGNMVNDVYNFDANGCMVTGWIKDAFGNMYYFNTAQNMDEGKMARGWREIGSIGNWYYFNDDGTLLTNGVTPDGTAVGSDGKLTTI